MTNQPSKLAKRIAEAVRRTHQSTYEDTIAGAGLADLEAKCQNREEARDKYFKAWKETQAKLAAAERERGCWKEGAQTWCKIAERYERERDEARASAMELANALAQSTQNRLATEGGGDAASNKG